MNATDTELAAAIEAGFVCGANSRKTEPPVAVVYQWICPLCDGTGRWSGGERCLNCHGHALTNDTPGYDETELTPAPRPPAVMKNPCVDCAYRPGSPEEDSATLPGPGGTAFFCHHGMHRIGDGYVETATIGGLPLGAMVCAGWWAQATDRPLPAKAFRDPGGSDRVEDAPAHLATPDTTTEPTRPTT